MGIVIVKHTSWHSFVQFVKMKMIVTLIGIVEPATTLICAGGGQNIQSFQRNKNSRCAPVLLPMLRRGAESSKNNHAVSVKLRSMLKSTMKIIQNLLRLNGFAGLAIK